MAVRVFGTCCAHRWFNSTPTGQVMNRFSKDVNVVDLELADCVNDFLLCTLLV